MVLRKIATCTVAACSLAMANFVGAAGLLIDDKVEGKITVTAGDFEYGLFVNSNLFQTGIIYPGVATQTFTTEGSMDFSGQWIDLGFTPTTNVTVFFVDALDPTRVSDILTYSTSSNGLTGYAGIGTFNARFKSSPDGSDLGALSDFGPGTVIVEGSNFTVGLPFMGFEVQTVAELQAVPEPGSLIVLGLGALPLFRRRR